MQNQDRMGSAGMDTGRNLPLVNGTPVYDANGDKVGDVSQYQSGDGYFVMTKGFFFPKDLYVPLNVIQRATTDGVYLGLTKDQINNENWDNPPSTTDRNARYAQGTAPDATMRTDQTARQGQRVDVPVAEEELVANKQREQIGDVKVHKDVTTQPESIEVPVSREEVHVKEVPASGQAATDVPDDAFQDRTINVPVYGEQVDVEKVPRVTDEVQIGKSRVTQDKRFTDTVKREDVVVDGPGDQKRVYRPEDTGQDQTRRAADDQDLTDQDVTPNR